MTQANLNAAFDRFESTIKHHKWQLMIIEEMIIKEMIIEEKENMDNY